MNDTAVHLITFVGAMTLVISSLLARRLPAADWIKMGLAWLAIFALLFLVIRTYQIVA